MKRLLLSILLLAVILLQAVCMKGPGLPKQGPSDWLAQGSKRLTSMMPIVTFAASVWSYELNLWVAAKSFPDHEFKGSVILCPLFRTLDSARSHPLMALWASIVLATSLWVGSLQKALAIAGQAIVCVGLLYLFLSFTVPVKNLLWPSVSSLALEQPTKMRQEAGQAAIALVAVVLVYAVTCHQPIYQLAVSVLVSGIMAIINHGLEHRNLHTSMSPPSQGNAIAFPNKTKEVQQKAEKKQVVEVEETKKKQLAEVEKQRLEEVEKQRLEVEERRVAEEKRVTEEKRVAEKKRVTEEKRVAEEKRAAEEKRVAEEKRAAKEAAKKLQPVEEPAAEDEEEEEDPDLVEFMKERAARLQREKEQEQ